jgi:hypothetical protein
VTGAPVAGRALIRRADSNRCRRRALKSTARQLPRGAPGAPSNHEQRALRTGRERWRAHASLFSPRAHTTRQCTCSLVQQQHAEEETAFVRLALDRLETASSTEGLQLSSAVPVYDIPASLRPVHLSAAARREELSRGFLPCSSSSTRCLQYPQSAARGFLPTFEKRMPETRRLSSNAPKILTSPRPRPRPIPDNPQRMRCVSIHRLMARAISLPAPAARARRRVCRDGSRWIWILAPGLERTYPPLEHCMSARCWLLRLRTARAPRTFTSRAHHESYTAPPAAHPNAPWHSHSAPTKDT